MRQRLGVRETQVPSHINLSDKVPMPGSHRAAAVRIKCRDTGQVARAVPDMLHAGILATVTLMLLRTEHWMEPRHWAGRRGGETIQ